MDMVQAALPGISASASVTSTKLGCVRPLTLAMLPVVAPFALYSVMQNIPMAVRFCRCSVPRKGTKRLHVHPHGVQFGAPAQIRQIDHKGTGDDLAA